MSVPPGESVAQSSSAARLEPGSSGSSGSAEFRFPDWAAPVDLPERTLRVPAEHTVRGMFVQLVLDAAAATSGKPLAAVRPAPFDDYPLRAWLDVLVYGASLAYPEVPVREGIRRFGQRAYATFASSVVGSVVVGGVGQDIRTLLWLMPRIYRVSGRGGSVEASFPEPNRAIMHLRDVWDFPDSYHAGFYEGGLRAVGASGQVKVRSLGQSSADIEILWS